MNSTIKVANFRVFLALEDSEDDMHDANDAESMDDDYYSGDTAVEYSDDDDDDGGDYEFENDLDDSIDVPIATANR